MFRPKRLDTIWRQTWLCWSSTSSTREFRTWVTSAKSFSRYSHAFFNTIICRTHMIQFDTVHTMQKCCWYNSLILGFDKLAPLWLCGLQKFAQSRDVGWSDREEHRILASLARDLQVQTVLGQGSRHSRSCEVMSKLWPNSKKRPLHYLMRFSFGPIQIIDYTFQTSDPPSLFITVYSKRVLLQLWSVQINKKECLKF